MYDSEMSKLSFNPLFLTIMCYSYVKKCHEEGSSDVQLDDSFYELIMTCVRLLLRDIDETKARDLPKAQQKALLKRRNTYLEEKEAFLKFFSYILFLKHQQVFDLYYLKKGIVEFFKVYNSKNVERIVKELDSYLTSYPNFALQLIFCGVFVIVNVCDDTTYYDFPHRRFREVLACEYILRHGHYISILAYMNNGHLFEFISVFGNSPIFKEKS